MKLFHVTTVVKEYDGCKDVAFEWFKEKPTGARRPYEHLIADYPHEVPPECAERYYPEGYIDELFTEHEAGQLADYLSTFRNSTTTINEVSLPAANNVMGLGDIAVGGGTDFYMLSKRDNYPLPFSVWGYFDKRFCERIDGTGT